MRTGVSGRDRSVFFRCLATLFESGVRLDRSFDLLSQQGECQPMRLAAAAVSLKLAAGQNLSRCLQSHPNCFSSFHVRMMQVGERSGSLGLMFRQLADHEEQRDKLQQRIRGSLFLPLLITVGCLLMVGVLLPILLNNILQLMAEHAQSLPWPTRLLMGVAAGLRSPFFYLLVPLGVGLGLAAWPKVRHNIRLMKAVEDRLLAMPGLGRLLCLAATAQFSHSLALMLETGLALLPSLELAGSTSGSWRLQELSSAAADRLRAGDDLPQALGVIPFFPAAYLSTLKAGGESGSMSEMLRFLARFYDLELDSSLDTFTRLLEPLVLAGVGALVGFCVIATLLPMARVLESL